MTLASPEAPQVSPRERAVSFIKGVHAELKNNPQYQAAWEGSEKFKPGKQVEVKTPNEITYQIANVTFPGPIDEQLPVKALSIVRTDPKKAIIESLTINSDGALNYFNRENPTDDIEIAFEAADRILKDIQGVNQMVA